IEGDRSEGTAHPVAALRRGVSAPLAVVKTPRGGRSAPARDQLFGERAPLGPKLHRQQTDAEEQIVQLVGVARLGPRLPAHFIDGARIEAAELAPEPGIDP